MKHGKRLLALTAASAFVVAACGSSKTASSSTATAAGAATAAAGATTASTAAAGATTAGTAAAGASGAIDDGSGATLLGGEIKCTQQYKGKEVHIFSPTRDSQNDHPIAGYLKAYAPFEKCTGAKMVWEGTDQFETEIKVRVAGGNSPDVIDFPQPGLLSSLAAKNQVVALPDNVAKHTNADFIDGWKQLSTGADGKVYGMPFQANVKSMVWYSPADFKAKGYAIPQTLDEMKTLSDKIAADGGIPWCAGIESGVATGWPVTDWFEDFMLRLEGPDVYDQWVKHTIPFNDPKVKVVADAVGSYLKNPKYIGSENAVKAITTTKFQEGGYPILDHKCYMHRQANFYGTSWPAGTTVAPDGQIWFFYLPVAKAGDKKVMLGAGDIYAAGTNKPETFDAILYTGSNDYINGLVAAGRSVLSPRKDFDTSQIKDVPTKAYAELLKSSEVFRFDGSDQMPGAVGAGTFWTEATAWIAGGSTDDMLNNIEKSWPK